MPRYDYKCKKCEAHEVIVHDFHATDTHECPMCGETMYKVISPTPAVFKAKGFYKTGG